MYNKTIIRFGFCDIQNNQGRGKGYQPQPPASADNPYLDLDYSGYRGSRRKLNMQNYCSLLISKFTNKGNQMKEA